MKRLSALMAGITLTWVFAAGCYMDKADQLYPQPIGCDTANVTFIATVQPILNSKCATPTCHDAGTKQSGYDFSKYEGAKTAVDNKRLIGVIKWQSGFSQMPKGMPQLDQCSIDKITRWVNLGAQNN